MPEAGPLADVRTEATDTLKARNAMFLAFMLCMVNTNVP